MEQETKLPEGLELAQLCCAHASFTGVPDADARTAHEAIRAEHAQRLALQHHAADMAQRVADLEAQRDAVQQARPVPAIPEGWKLVPVEPTPEMEEVAERVIVAFDASTPTWAGTAGKAYRAMIAAAPEHKA